MSLLTAFFGPGNQRTGKGEEPTVVWSDGWQESFKSLTDQKLVVSPVLRSLVFSKSTKVSNDIRSVIFGRHAS